LLLNLIFCINEQKSYFALFIIKSIDIRIINDVTGSDLSCYLEVHDLFCVEFSEGDTSGHQDGRRFRNPEDFPPDALEEGCQLGLEKMNEYFLLIINLKVENSFQKYFHSFESRVLKISLPFFHSNFLF